MANFNKVLLMGNLTRDPQLSYLPSQTAVVDFGLAVNRRWKSREGEDRQETCFVDCRAFGVQAENINKYLSKGRPVFIEGRLTFDSWTAQDGTRRSRHRVTVDNCQFLGGKPASGAPGASSAEQPEQTQDAWEGSKAQGEPEKQTSADDIPF